MAEKISILWADDEIDLLKPYIIFLTGKGYDVSTVNSGNDAVSLIKTKAFDIILLDENMPGLTGLETLRLIKADLPNVPIVMITKSEEEHIMNDAIGSQISDYLIKPVNPNQILLAIKKNTENKRLISEKTAVNYQQEFLSLSNRISSISEYDEWIELYKKLTYWELEISKAKEESLLSILIEQKKQANQLFSRYVENNYIDWINNNSDKKPLLSHTAFKSKVSPLISEEYSTFLIVVDNLRFDQWKILQHHFEERFRINEENVYCSILPSATQYSRNAFFAGLMPTEIEKLFPQLWLNEEDEGTKNQHEEELVTLQLKRLGKPVKHSFYKILNVNFAKKYVDNMKNLMSNPLNILVYNFVDTLSHARTESDIIKELAEDEAAYRSLILSWFEHSPLMDIINYLSEKKVKIVLTTDHGSIRVTRPVKVIGDKSTSTNLRYKRGKGLDYNKKEVFEVRKPETAYLPKNHINSEYIFSRESDFLVYPNNMNQYINIYKNTFQHGGISMEEMLIPLVIMSNK